METKVFIESLSEGALRHDTEHRQVSCHSFSYDKQSIKVIVDFVHFLNVLVLAALHLDRHFFQQPGFVKVTRVGSVVALPDFDLESFGFVGNAVKCVVISKFVIKMVL